MAAAALLLAGCNPVARISGNAGAIRNEANALVDHGNATGDQTVVDGANRIVGYADAIQGDIPNIEPKVPAWLSTLQWWGIAAACIAVFLILWRSGALTAIRIAIGWLPRRKVNDAELALKMLGSEEETPREYVAAKRAADPEWDAAWRKLNKEKP